MGLLPIIATFSISLHFPIHHCSWSFIRFLLYWRSRDLCILYTAFGEEGNNEHPKVQHKYRSSIIVEVHMTWSSKLWVPSSSAFIWSAAIVCSDPGHLHLTEISMKALTGTHVHDQAVHDSRFSCWHDNILGINKSAHDLSLQVWTRTVRSYWSGDPKHRWQCVVEKNWTNMIITARCCRYG